MVDDCDRPILFQIHFYCGIVPSEVLVDGVIDDFPDAVVQGRAVVRVT